LLQYLPLALINVEELISPSPPLDCFKGNQISNAKEIYKILLPEIRIKKSTLNTLER
jgi:hypothetical protein